MVAGNTYVRYLEDKGMPDEANPVCILWGPYHLHPDTLINQVGAVVVHSKIIQIVAIFD